MKVWKFPVLATSLTWSNLGEIKRSRKRVCDRCRVLADQAERAMKDQQTLLEHKESELRSMEEHVRLLEEQVSSLKRISEADRDELSKLRATVAALDREKDELQIAVDEKTEQEASRVDAVATRVSDISLLSSTRLW